MEISIKQVIGRFPFKKSLRIYSGSCKALLCTLNVICILVSIILVIVTLYLLIHCADKGGLNQSLEQSSQEWDTTTTGWAWLVLRWKTVREYQVL